MEKEKNNDELQIEKREQNATMNVCITATFITTFMTARSVEQSSVFEAAEKFARTEGILPAPESSHEDDNLCD